MPPAQQQRFQAHACAVPAASLSPDLWRSLRSRDQRTHAWPCRSQRRSPGRCVPACRRRRAPRQRVRRGIQVGISRRPTPPTQSSVRAWSRNDADTPSLLSLIQRCSERTLAGKISKNYPCDPSAKVRPDAGSHRLVKVRLAGGWREAWRQHKPPPAPGRGPRRRRQLRAARAREPRQRRLALPPGAHRGRRHPG